MSPKEKTPEATLIYTLCLWASSDTPTYQYETWCSASVGR